MITRCRPLLGTFVEVTVPDGATNAIEPAFDVITHIHVCMSFHEPGSDLARLRSARLGGSVEVDRETVTVLRMAQSLFTATDGLFDVGVGRALVHGHFLPHEGIGHLNHYLGTTADIEVIDERHVRCRKGVLIDLGGIAKGYAVDRAVEVLVAAGAVAGLVNAGGDLRMFGDRDWETQLRDADGQVRQSIVARDCAIASSANLLNRHRVRREMHSPHIGRNGVPVLIDHRVSVVAETCMIADAMTKVAMVDPDLADNILAKHKGYVLRQDTQPGTT